MTQTVAKGGGGKERSAVEISMMHDTNQVMI